MAKVYDHVTGGVASKPMTDPAVVIHLHDEVIQKACNEAYDEGYGDGEE